MSYLTQPENWNDGVKKLQQKEEIASTLNSEQWTGVPEGLRDRAYFSARVASARFLERARGITSAFLNSMREEVPLPDGSKTTMLKTGSRADFINQMQQWARGEKPVAVIGKHKFYKLKK